jgi:hypothetical protein
MKRFIAVAVLGLTLAGCQTTSPPVVVAPPSPSITPIEEKIIDIREQVLRVCNFIPATAFLTSLITSNPAFSTVTDYASAICKVAILPLPRASGASRYVVRMYPGTVNGIRVVGRFSTS